MDFSKKVNSKVKKNIAAKGNQVPEWPRWPSGSLSLDVELGGGVPEGKVVGVIGEFSSGKTATTLKMTGEYQKKYPDRPVLWIDAEGAWDPRWAKALGIDISRIDVVRPQYGEQAYEIILAFYDEGPGLAVLDSAAALASKKEIEDDMESIQVAGMAKIHAKFMRKVTAAFDEGDDPPSFIYINQLRQNVAGYGPPLIETGGEALTKYFPSVKILLKTGDYYDGNKTYTSNSTILEDVEVKAQIVKFFIEKNKTAPPKRRGFFWLYFDTLDKMRPKGSIDRLDEIIRLTRKYNIVEQSVGESGKKGSMFTLLNDDTGEVRQFKGAKALADFIRSDDATREWVEKKVLDRVLGDMAADETETDQDPVQEESVVRELKLVDNEGEGDESSEAV